MTLGEMRRLYVAGFTVTVISERSGIPESTVRYRLRAAGVALRPRGSNMPCRVDPAVLTDTVAAYRQMGAGGAARHLGVDDDTVRHRLRLAGEPRTNTKHLSFPPAPEGYAFVPEAGRLRGQNPDYLRNLCTKGRIDGAIREQVYPYRWLVPVPESAGSRR